MRILIVTDAWHPQINGVVRTLDQTIRQLRTLGHTVEVIAPSDGYFTLPLPTYPDIRLAPFAYPDVKRRMLAFGPEAVHIATEGPLGYMARSLCLKWGLPFTTSYHTKFPEYVKLRAPFIPLSWLYKGVRKFHNTGGRTMVATASMMEFLRNRGFSELASWARGVDLTQFNPNKRHSAGNEHEADNGYKDVYAGLPRPIFVNIGRVAVEKNIQAFLDLDLPGSKVIVGGGPQLASLHRQYPDVTFTGPKDDVDLARHFADADVFVFPSRTDTFGLVIIESMACGTPVAAFPVSGPIDIIPGSKAGCVDTDLRKAAIAALRLNRMDAAAHAQTYSWQAVTQRFLDLLTPDYTPISRNRWRKLRRASYLASRPLYGVGSALRKTWNLVKDGA